MDVKNLVDDINATLPFEAPNGAVITRVDVDPSNSNFLMHYFEDGTTERLPTLLVAEIFNNRPRH